MSTTTQPAFERMPRRHTWRFVSLEQIVWVAPMTVITLITSRFSTSLFWVVAGLTIIGWVHTRHGALWLSPVRLVRRFNIWRRHGIMRDIPLPLRSATLDASEPNVRWWPTRVEAILSHLTYTDTDGYPAYMPITTCDNGTHGAVYVSARDAGRMATSGPEGRAMGVAALTAALTRIANHPNRIQVAQIYRCGPDGETGEAAWLEDHGRSIDPNSQSDARDAKEFLDAVAASPGTRVDRVFSVMTRLPNGWRRHIGNGSLDPKRREPNPPPPRETIFGQPPLSLLDILRRGLEASGAQEVKTMGLVDLTTFIGGALDGERSVEFDRQRAADERAMARDEVESLDELRTLQDGAFPRTFRAGHNWLRTGSTLNRIFVVDGYTEEDYPLDFFEKILEELQLPCLVSTVWHTRPGRTEVVKRNETARSLEILRRVTDAGYDTEPAATQDAMAEVERQRDEVHWSRAPGISLLTIVVVHAPDMATLRVREEQVKGVFEDHGAKLAPILGAEHQLEFLRLALNLGRLPFDA